jgi:hypothetical protein
VESPTLVHLELSVVRDADRVPLERPRCRSFEVDAVLVEAAAVARALELLLGLEPAGRAPQVRADGLERVDLLIPLEVTVHHPHAVLGYELRLDLSRGKAVL